MRTKNDPTTGQFAKGNPGRAKGSKNMRTLKWEELGREIMDGNAGRFNELLGRLWDSRDPSEQVKAAELFLKVAEFFKPKLQRTQVQMENEAMVIPPLIVIEGVAQVPENWPGPAIHIHREVVGGGNQGRETRSSQLPVVSGRKTGLTDNQTDNPKTTIAGNPCYC